MSSNNIYVKAYGAREGATSGFMGWRNRMRIRFFLEWVAPQQNERILEVGCNRALLLRTFKEHGAIVAGVDINREVVRELGLSYVRQGNAEHLPYNPNSFDKVIATEVLEHVQNPKKALQEISRVLKPGGRAFITYPIEPIRGIGALGDALFVFKSLRHARLLHVTRFSRKSFKALLKTTKFVWKNDFVRFLSWPLRCIELMKH